MFKKHRILVLNANLLNLIQKYMKHMICVTSIYNEQRNLSLSYNF